MNRNIYRFCAPLLAAVILAGCGGGGGASFPIVTAPPPATVPPAEVSAYDKFLNYVKDLVATALDTIEPADVSAFDPPPTSDTVEPVSTQ